MSSFDVLYEISKEIDILVFLHEKIKKMGIMGKPVNTLPDYIAKIWECGLQGAQHEEIFISGRRWRAY